MSLGESTEREKMMNGKTDRTAHVFLLGKASGWHDAAVDLEECLRMNGDLAALLVRFQKLAHLYDESAAVAESR